MISLPGRLLAVVVPLVACISSVESFADSESVVVVVRAIKAAQIERDGSDIDKAARKADLNQPGIKDIKDKLKKLKYNHLTLMSEQEKRVAMNSKETFTLVDGNVISFRPVSKNKDKVCLWLNWKDSSGMNVIDTRLHFNGNETVITGMDTPNGSGIVLAIDVKE